MISYVEGNLFESPAQVLVNTVNTVGVMGKGIALEFKRIFPEMFLEYRDLCERGELTIGRLHLFKTPHKWILNFPTKKDWRQPSRVEYIEAGLRTFVRMHAKEGISSIAFPPLGCGNGQLDFKTQVQPLLEKYLRPLPITTFVYPEKPRTGLAEHENAKDISEWLRSEPASLPFDEVWSDLIASLDQEGSSFQTPANKKPYQIEAVENPPSLEVLVGGKGYKIEHDDLLEFWQQLRQFGFAFRGITPDHQRLYYLIPLFERLQYVRRVTVSTSPDGLERNRAIGLQVVPPRREKSEAGDLFSPRIHEG